MKNLLAITLVFILSLFIVGESRGEVKDTILSCVPTEPIEYPDDYIGTYGYATDAETSLFREKIFIHIYGGSKPTAHIYMDFYERDEGIYSVYEFNVDEFINKLRIQLKEDNNIWMDFLLQRETLSGEFSDLFWKMKYEIKCDILSSVYTIQEYADDHLKTYRDNRSKKNKL
ncbi:MAG: hypothetical protein CML98_00660 [Rhodobiaceae bacterium]|nr:hypothetical protein [Rhodobiaceae bacterium]